MTTGVGGCSNVLKSKNAEDFGFKAILITVSDKDFKSLEDGNVASVENISNEERRTMEERTIPEIMLKETDSKKISKQLNKLYKKGRDVKQEESVYIMIDLAIRHPDNHVEVELWFSTLLDIPYKLIKGMHMYHQLLGQSVSFQPRIATFACTDCPQETKEKDCLSDGKYCPFQPQHRNF